jgi:DNA-binding transcriptional MerR regulator
MAGLWTLDELSARLARALGADYGGQPSGRVRDVPDGRTIRYYTTLGLLERPVLRGRTALYGRRQLLQLVAIKRLQAQGLTLAEVQARLLGRTDEALAEVARLPAGADGEMPDEPAVDRRSAFWKETPAPPAPPVRPLLGVPLTEGVTLLLAAARPPAEHDLEALREAAAPLLELLQARRLLAEPAGPAGAKGGPSCQERCP